MTSPATNSSLKMIFDAVTYPKPKDRIAAWRDAFSLTVDVDVTDAEIDGFKGFLYYCSFGSALLVERGYSSHTVIRSRKTISRTATDKLVLHYFRDGGISGIVGDRHISAAAGDCFLYDTRGTLRIRMIAGSFVGLILPRAFFEKVIGRSGNLHGLVIQAGEPQASLLGLLLSGLARQSNQFPANTLPQLGAALLEVVASLIGGLLEPPSQVRHGVFHAAAQVPPITFSQICRYIDRNAADERLNAESLASVFGLSRAALYRLFHSKGGVARVIRQRRAALAVRALHKVTTKPLPLLSIARSSGFQDVAALRRALHAVFKASPSQLQKDSLEAGARVSVLAIAALFDELPS